MENEVKSKELVMKMARLGAKNKELYQSIGLLATCFGGLEICLIECVSLLILCAQSRDKTDLNVLGFNRTVKLFESLVQEVFLEEEIRREAGGLVDKMIKVSRQRNDIIHSVWVCITEHEYRQQRPRKQPGHQSHIETRQSDPKFVDDVSISIFDLMFDLACFKDRLYLLGASAECLASHAELGPEWR